MKKLLLASFCSLLMSTTLQGMFKKLNIPFFYARSTLKNYIPTKTLEPYKTIPPLTTSKDLQILTALISQDLKKISTQITELQKSVATRQDLENIKKENTHE